MSKEAVWSVVVLLATALLYFLWEAVKTVWLNPRRIRKGFEAQGVKCLPRGPFSISGNLPELVALTAAARAQPLPHLSHDIAPRLLPHDFLWRKQYGDLFVYWFGPQARFTLTEPEQAKEILNNKFGHYGKLKGRPDNRVQGLAGLEGKKWAQHRRIMNPAFFVEKLKAMTPTMAACTVAMMEGWEAQVEKGETVDVHENFRTLTADIIAHTAFGSSYAEGKQIFEMQHEQQALLEKDLRTLYIPGSRFVPTPTNRYRRKLNNKLAKVLSQLIEKRNMESGKDGFGQDLLGLMMTANQGQLQGTQKNLAMGIDEIIAECRTFFFAGHETTSTLLTWTFLLLAISLEWQERVRNEVHAVCGTTELPTAESVNQLKLVGMVLNEALRLYPPAILMARKAITDKESNN